MFSLACESRGGFYFFFKIMTEDDYKKLSKICRAYDQITLMNLYHRDFPKGDVRVSSIEVFTSDGLFKLEESEIDVEAVRNLFRKRDEAMKANIEQAKKAFERVIIDFCDEKGEQEAGCSEQGGGQD